MTPSYVNKSCGELLDTTQILTKHALCENCMVFAQEYPDYFPIKHTDFNIGDTYKCGAAQCMVRTVACIPCCVWHTCAGCLELVSSEQDSRRNITLRAQNFERWNDTTLCFFLCKAREVLGP